jgi:hypothetical protein
MIEQKMLIAGQECAAGNGATFERKNPLDGSVATRARQPRPRMRFAPAMQRQQPSPPGRNWGRTPAAPC